MTAEEWLADLEAKAKAATPGAWHIIEADDERFMCAVYVATTPEDTTPNVIAVTLLQSPRVACIADEKWDENAAHIATNSPPTVMADIDEILRLREQVERLEKEADWLAHALVERGHVIGDIKDADFRTQWRKAARKAAMPNQA